MKKHSIIFDWDGTLADSFDKILACKQEIAQELGLIAPTAEKLKMALGKPIESAMSICFPMVNNKVLAGIIDGFHQKMQQPEYQAELFPGVIDLLFELKKKNYRLAIATSKARSELEPILQGLSEKYNEEFFEFIAYGEDFNPGKPNPAMIEKLMMQLGNHNKDEYVLIGDAVTDVKLAKNAGIKCIAVGYGAGSHEALQQAGADTVLATVAELSACFGLNIN